MLVIFHENNTQNDDNAQVFDHENIINQPQPNVKFSWNFYLEKIFKNTPKF